VRNILSFIQPMSLVIRLGKYNAFPRYAPEA
jgi:hypothetical protein